MGSWFLFLRCLWLKLKETVLRWLLAVDTSPNALAISPHTMGIFSGRYLFMKHEAHCRGLRYRPRMLWLRIMQARGPGGSESGEIELLTPPESQRAFGWVKFSPTSCERWVKGGLGNVARVTARGGRACWEGGEDGQMDEWMDGWNLCKRKLWGQTQPSPVVCQDGAHSWASSSSCLDENCGFTANWDVQHIFILS